MAWYYGTFSCGHEGRVNIIGPTKSRQWKADKKFEGLCEECFYKWVEEEKQRKKEEAAKKAKEMELPELIGSPKQVEWANTLRNNLIEKIEKKQSNIEDFKDDLESSIYCLESKEINSIIKNLDSILDEILLKTKAKWFIDMRNSTVTLLREVNKEVESKYDIDKIMEREIIKEGTISPDNVTYDGVVEIRASKNLITIFYEKNETFRSIVKELNYVWNDNWKRKLDETTGSYIDRAAELGNKLLNKGFSISIQDEDIREKAIKGDFEKECTRWIYARRNSSDLAINWGGYDDGLYNISKQLSGAKWSKPSMLVNVSHFNEIQEFAELYEFKFTEKALKLIEQYKKELNNIDIVSPKKVEADIPKDGLNDILNSSREIIDDLRD